MTNKGLETKLEKHSTRDKGINPPKEVEPQQELDTRHKSLIQQYKAIDHLNSISPSKYKLDISPSLSEEEPANVISNLSEKEQVSLSVKEPRLNEDKCINSPFIWHRYVKQTATKHENGSRSIILRCRYCSRFVQVFISYKKNKAGQMVAYKQSKVVEDEVD